MPETEGTTCTSCFTLNPPGAPSCIRCNQPLPATAPTNGPGAGPAAVPANPAPGDGSGPPPTTRPTARGATAAGATDWPGAAGAGGATTRPAGRGAAGTGGATDWPGAAGATGATDRPGVGGAAGAGDWSGAGPAAGAEAAAGAGVRPGEYNFPAPTPTPRGLAVPPKGAPGGSRSAAVPAQPPGYGMGAKDRGAAPVEMSPAEQRRISRRIAIVGGIIVVLVLAVGGGALWLTRPKYLDVDPVATGIGTALTKRAGETVTVRCQGTPRLKAGETFRCTATDRHGVARMVEVTVLDASGRYEWTLS